MMAGMLLASDVGGTKTLLGLYRPDGDRPAPVAVREYPTLDFDSLDDLVQVFLEETGVSTVDAVCAGIAGPVTGLVARLTVAPWVADIGLVAERLGECPAALINDLEAMAYAIPVLEPDEVFVLQEGSETPSGNMAVLAAGTGLGAALLHYLDGRFVPLATEAGHADFAARTPRELQMVDELARIHGRVEVERVLSGRGLTNIARFTHGAQDLRRVCPALVLEAEESEWSASVSRAALEGRCNACGEALDMFVGAYGAEAGNLALRSVATGGVFIGGGIAPKILPAMKNGLFMEGFLDKEPMTELLKTLPVKVILNPASALIGAAVRASALLLEDVKR